MRKKALLRKAGTVIFFIYIAALTYFLFFADWFDHSPGAHWVSSYNYVPFREIRRFAHVFARRPSAGAFLNLFGNVIGFMPLGFFLPVMSRSFRSFRCACAAGFILSCVVELIQFVTHSGCCDVDDVLLNTAGAMIGYGLFLLCDALRRKVHERYG